MIRKTILYIAMTLDGYIADEKDQISFLDNYHDIKFTNETYKNLLNRIDTLIMGKNTYDVLETLVSAWPYPNFKTYILTSSHEVSKESITFVNSGIDQLMNELVHQNGKDIWIVGGGKIVQTLLNMNYIDEFHLTIIPKLLGKGKPLFHTLNHELDLKLIKTIVEGDLVMLIYKCK